MDKEKEIEEMTAIIKQNTYADNFLSDSWYVSGQGRAAKELANAGYRKADEVRKETAKEIVTELKDSSLTAILTFNREVAEELKTIYLCLEKEYGLEDEE